MHNKNKVKEYKQFTIVMSGADLVYILKGLDKLISESWSI